MLLRGRPLRFLGVASVSTSAALASAPRPSSCAWPQMSSSAGGWVFRGRPRLLLDVSSVSASAVLVSAALGRRACEGALFLSGVPLRLVGASDFLGRPRRLTGDGWSGSLSGTFVVLVLVTCFMLGESMFSLSLPGSACTVTLMRHGLWPPVRGVLSSICLVGDDSSKSAVAGLRFCLLGELEARGRCFGARVAVGLGAAAGTRSSSKDAASGSGDDSMDAILRYGRLQLAECDVCQK